MTEEPDLWAEHHDACVRQFTEAVEWLGADWVADNYEPMTRLRDGLRDIDQNRNTFSGPSLEYMQGYRTGQEYQAKLAREALGDLL